MTQPPKAPQTPEKPLSQESEAPPALSPAIPNDQAP
ncbi:MAG: cutinase, partial [Alphaproteobacteria bacterium]|nr:cutinase [Alphaproteobacteria bacterium]